MKGFWPIFITLLFLMSCTSSQVQIQGSFVQDVDQDLIFDFNDNCKRASNNDQSDYDQDGSGNVCDRTPFGSCKDLCPKLISYQFNINTGTHLELDIGQCKDMAFHQDVLKNECERYEIKALGSGECCCRGIFQELASDCEIQEFTFDYIKLRNKDAIKALR